MTPTQARVIAAARALMECVGVDARYTSVVWPTDNDGNGLEGAPEEAAHELRAALDALDTHRDSHGPVERVGLGGPE